MRLLDLFRKRHAASRYRAPARVCRPARWRPRLEALEDRCLLSATGLDPTFGSGGLATTDFPLLESAGNGAVAVASGGGKTVVAGATWAALGTGYSDFALARYNGDGSLDSSFGTGGRVTIHGGFNAVATGVAVMDDGCVVVAGYDNTGTGYNFAVYRLTNTGQLDSSFGVRGEQTIDFGKDAVATGLALQSNGSIVVGGYTIGTSTRNLGSNVLQQTNRDFAVARLTACGQLDPTFNGTGKLTIDFGLDDFATGVAVGPDCSVALAGYSGVDGDTLRNFVVTHVTASGQLDTSFGVGGEQTTGFGTRDDYRGGVAVQSDGSVVAAGTSYEGSATGYDFGVVRLTTSGQFDPFFNGTGKQTIDFGGNHDLASSVALQCDDSIVVAGFSAPAVHAGRDFAVARLTCTGQLDTSFNGTGEQTIDFGNTEDTASGLVVQSGGRVVVAGDSSQPVTRDDFAVAQLTCTGQLDASFNGGGKVLTDFVRATPSNDRAAAVALTPNRELVVAGSTDEARTGGHFAVALYNANGSLDTSFGTGARSSFNPITGQVDPGTTFGTPGEVSLDSGGVATGVAVEGNGSILVAGDASNDFEVVRLTCTGQLDTTFGTGGTVFIAFGATAFATGLAVQADDGDIVVVGYGYQPGSGHRDLEVARLTSTGQLDPNFGVGGEQIIDLGSDVAATTAPVLQSDGKIVLAGYASGYGQFVARLTCNGQLDPSFFGTGTRNIHFVFGSSNADPAGVAVQADGNIVVAGTANLNAGTGYDFAVTRLISDGQIDTSFGAGGRQTIDLGTQGDVAASVALEPDGDIVVAGDSPQGSTGEDFAVAQLTSTGQLRRSFGSGGKVTTDFGSPEDSAYGVVVQPDGNMVVAGSSNQSSTGYDFAVARYLTPTNRPATTVTSSAAPSVFGQSVTFTATVSAVPPDVTPPTGYVDFVDTTTGTDLGTAPLSGGSAALAASFFALGDHAIKATYLGDDYYLRSSSAAFTQTVNPDATATVVSSSATPSVFTQVVKLTATVSAAAPGSGTPTGGDVDFVDTTTGTDLGTAHLCGGSAVLPVSSLAVGDHAITATYNGNGNFLSSTSAAFTQTVNAMTRENLNAVLTAQVSNSGSAAVTLQASDDASAQDVVGVMNSVAAPTDASGNPVPAAINLTLNFAKTTALTFGNGDPNVTLELDGSPVPNGTTVDPAVPAVLVTQGNLIIKHVTFTESGDAPTILVTGGHLTLRNDIVQESTGSGQAAIAVTGGTLDLGSAASPGGNTINVNGTGRLILDSGPNLVTAVGNTLTADGAPVAPMTLTTVSSSAPASLLNQPVNFTATVSAVASGAGTPTGSVYFKDLTTGTFLGSALLSGGSATLTTAALPVGAHTIVAVYGGDASFITSYGTASQVVTYKFSGFLAPLNSNLAFGLNRTVPIKFQLTDYANNFITSPGAITSLQVLNAQGTNVLTNAGSTALRYDPTANQFVANWQTKGLPAGTYTVRLALADGTVQQKTIQLTANGNGANAQAADSSDISEGGTSGQLLGGDLDVYVDNRNGALTPDELARIQDAVTAVDALTEPYGVAVVEVTDPTLAEVTLTMDTSSPVGGHAEGILGCWDPTGSDITLIQGWDWYAGSDPTQIASNQYDLQTTLTHELGHALGLGESDDPTSAMSGTLATGTVIRTLTTADLNIPEGETAADAQRAAGFAVAAADARPAAAQVVPARGLDLPRASSNEVAHLQPEPLHQAMLDLAGTAGAAPDGTRSSLLANDVALAGWSSVFAGVNLPNLTTALPGRDPQSARSAANATHGDSRPDVDGFAVPPASAELPLPHFSVPAQKVPARAASPIAAPDGRDGLSVAAVDSFFEAAGRRADRLIGSATGAEQTDDPGPHRLADAGIVLFALLGTTQGVREVEPEARKRRRPQHAWLGKTGGIRE
jgi:uncharacterized delta-60 repeat protein